MKYHNPYWTQYVKCQPYQKDLHSMKTHDLKLYFLFFGRLLNPDYCNQEVRLWPHQDFWRSGAPAQPLFRKSFLSLSDKKATNWQGKICPKVTFLRHLKWSVNVNKWCPILGGHIQFLPSYVQVFWVILTPPLKLDIIYAHSLAM